MNTVTLVLYGATALTAVLWLLEMFVLKPKRKEALRQAEISQSVPLTRREKEEIVNGNGALTSLAGCFPVLFAVLLIRSFLCEPFRIPSASMMPTLLRGDFVLVQKFSYGIRNPVTNRVLIETSSPARGDVVVFKYPVDPGIDYIKRVIGLPGDTVFFAKGELMIREKGSSEIKRITAVEDAPEAQRWNRPNALYPSEFGLTGTEDLLGVRHKIMRDSSARIVEPFYVQKEDAYGEWTVPENTYFVMGDNREHSRDSRFWGFVPDEYLIGRAFCIWFSGTMDSGIRFDRLGGLR